MIVRPSNGRIYGHPEVHQFHRPFASIVIQLQTKKPEPVRFTARLTVCGCCWSLLRGNGGMASIVTAAQVQNESNVCTVLSSTALAFIKCNWVTPLHPAARDEDHGPHLYHERLPSSCKPKSTCQLGKHCILPARVSLNNQTHGTTASMNSVYIGAYDVSLPQVLRMFCDMQYSQGFQTRKGMQISEGFVFMRAAFFIIFYYVFFFRSVRFSSSLPACLACFTIKPTPDILLQTFRY